jgi:outer membrane receptor for ferrienterochelin and colicins
MCTAVLLLAATTAATAATLKGTVLDAYTRQPVPYAEVYAYELDERVWADGAGSFRLGTAPGVLRVSVEVSRVGYQDRRWSRLKTSQPATLYLLPGLIQLKGVTVSAYRSPTPADRSGPVSVIEGTDLLARGRTSVAEVIAGTPAVVIQDYGNLSTIALRGATSEQTLVLLDGVKLNSAQDNLVDVSTLPLMLAGRVELARGGISALYGANSVGGVANVMTPDPSRFGARATAGLGPFGKRYLQLVHTNWSAPLGYLVGLNLARATDDFPYRDSLDSTRLRANSDFANTGVVAKGLLSQGRHRAALLGEYDLARRGSPGPITFPPDSARMDDARGIAHLNYGFQESDNARFEATLYHHRFWRNYRSPLYATNDTHYVTATGAMLSQNLYLSRWGKLLAGIETERQGFSSTAIGNPLRQTNSGWAQARLEWRALSVTPAARYDWLTESKPMPDSSTFRSTERVLSPRLSLAYSLNRWVNLYAGIGRSFRTPTFNELYWPRQVFVDTNSHTTYITQGNARVKPELATSVDLGASARYRSLLACRLGLWHSFMTNLIQWQTTQQADTFLTQIVNLDTATISGAELEANLDLGYAGLGGNATYTVARSRGKDLVYRPRLSSRATAWLGPKWLRLSATAQYVGKRYTTADDSDSLPGYFLTDAECSVSPALVRPTVTLRGGIRNLFDRQYQTTKGYPVPGRNWYAELGLEI